MSRIELKLSPLLHSHVLFFKCLSKTLLLSLSTPHLPATFFKKSPKKQKEREPKHADISESYLSVSILGRIGIWGRGWRGRGDRVTLFQINHAVLSSFLRKVVL